MTVRNFASLAVMCLAASACGGGSSGSSSPTSPNTPTVADKINATASLTFNPATLTTQVGHAVTFGFGSVAHNVFFDAATGVPADITGSNANISITRTFNTAGTFTYTCHIHPQMHGTVVVQ
jgi:plastocyanin